MASTFPAAIANEPPPLDVSSEDEDSEDFRSHGLKLDVPSGEPTPVSTPFKRPITKSPKKIESTVVDDNDLEENEEFSVQITPPEMHANHSPAESSPTSSENEGALAHAATQILPDTGNNDDVPVSVNGEVVEEQRDVEAFTAENHENNIAVKEAGDNVPISASYVQAAETHCDNNIITSCDGTEVNADEYSTSTKFTAEVAENYDVGEELHLNLVSRDDPELESTESRENILPQILNDPKENLIVESSVPDNLYNPENLVETQELDLVTQVEEEAAESPSADTHVTGHSPIESIHKTDEIVDDDEFDDFGAFQSIPNTNTNNLLNTNSSSQYSGLKEEEEDDDFGDFAQVPAHTTSNIVTSKQPAQSNAEQTEEFADFQDCSFQSCSVPPFVASSSSMSSDFSAITNKMDSIIKSLFVIDPTWIGRENDGIKAIDSEISISNDNVWSRVQDFEGSQGLMFKWLNSLTEKKLLGSLKIDTSTIMYHEKWGTIEVPKFAASLVQTPLQPQSCNYSESQTKNNTHHHTVVNNNNNNILDGVSIQDHDKAPSISAEAEDILRQLPDLSYMRANTLVFPQTSPSD